MQELEALQSGIYIYAFITWHNGSCIIYILCMIRSDRHQFESYIRKIRLILMNVCVDEVLFKIFEFYMCHCRKLPL